MIELHRFDSAGKPLKPGALAPPAPDAEETLWVDVLDPTADDLDALKAAFPLHALSMEDAARVGHPPKIESFEQYLFVIVHTPVHDDDGLTRKLAVFLGHGWIITILRLPVANLDATLARLRASPGQVGEGAAKILYMLVDAMTDGFEREVDAVSDQLSDLEVRTQQDPDDDAMSDILDLRNELTRLARVVRGQRDVAALLARTPYDHIPEALNPYLRDVFEHLLRVHDQIEGARDGVLAVRDLHLAMVNTRLSETMRVLTVIATIMMPLSLLAGVWGMNVAGLPGLEWKGAFWTVSAAMVAVAVLMLIWFRRRGWI